MLHEENGHAPRLGGEQGEVVPVAGRPTLVAEGDAPAGPGRAGPPAEQSQEPWGLPPDFLSSPGRRRIPSFGSEPPPQPTLKRHLSGQDLENELPSSGQERLLRGGTARLFSTAEAVLSLEEKFANGFDPTELWAPGATYGRLRMDVAEALTGIPHEIVCRAVVLNCRMHPTFACLLGAYALKKNGRRVKLKNAVVGEALMVLSVKLQQLACGVLRTYSPDQITELLLAQHGQHHAEHGRSLLDLAVETSSSIFLNSAEVQRVVGLLWTGEVRWSGQRGVESITRPAAGEAGYVWQARVRPLVGLLGLPFLAMLPAQMLHEEQFVAVYTPRLRYWTLQLSYVLFSILMLYVTPCTIASGCALSLDIDVLLGFWLLGFVIAEMQAIWHVARVLMERGGNRLESLLYLHRTNSGKKLDTCMLALTLVAGIMRVISRVYHPVADEYVRSLAYLFLWGRPLIFLSQERHLGPLLASMTRMVTHDISRYAILQVLSVVAFSAAFSALYGGDDGASGQFLGTIQVAVQTLSEQTLMLGDPTSGPLWQLLPDSKAPQFGWALMSAFGVVSSLMLLNLLIGMLAASFDHVRSRAQLMHSLGVAREVLRGMALPIIPPPYNLLQLPLTFCYSAFEPFFSQGEDASAAASRNKAAEGSFHNGEGGDSSFHRSASKFALFSWSGVPAEQRAEIFAAAYDDVGWQLPPQDGQEAWKLSISRSLFLVSRENEELKASLARQEALLGALCTALGVQVEAAAAAAGGGMARAASHSSMGRADLHEPA